jgi:hypothetical protein
MTAFTRPPETAEDAEELILRALLDEPSVPLNRFDNACDRRLLANAIARLTRAGLADIQNGHVRLAQPVIHHEKETTVNTAALNRIADALEAIADKLGEPKSAPTSTPKSTPEPQPVSTAKATLLPGVAMPRRPAGRPRKPKPGDSKRIESTIKAVLELLSTGPATDTELRGVLPNEQSRLLYPAMISAVERGLVVCHRLGKTDRFTLDTAERKTA